MDSKPDNQGMPKRFLTKHAVTFKMGWVLFLVFVLLIPLGMIRSVLRERTGRRDGAVAEITSSWGRDQVVVGPVLVIPYQYRVKTWKVQTVNGKQERFEVEETNSANAFFLPDERAVAGTVSPDKLHRGIYDAVVYKGHLDISGRFPAPPFAEMGISKDSVQWENALVTMAVSDLRGTGEILDITMGGQICRFAPGCQLNGYPSGITARVPGVNGEATNLDFSMALDLKGSGGLSFAPVGQQNRIKLASTWPDPSFRGAFLPADRTVGAEGFNASWEVSWYGRNFPQQSTDQARGGAVNAESIEPSLFGVDFMSLVDSYRMVERATKYGALYIALIFTAFFLFEVLLALRIHTIQYTLVGAALCLFYLALLSLSEFIRFPSAYWAGAAVSSLLIILYSLKVLGGGVRTMILAAALFVIYAYLYVVLQLQDYSLLFGTAGLFIVLGIVMYSTRNMDWSARD